MAAVPSSINMPLVAETYYRKQIETSIIYYLSAFKWKLNLDKLMGIK